MAKTQHVRSSAAQSQSAEKLFSLKCLHDYKISRSFAVLIQNSVATLTEEPTDRGSLQELFLLLYSSTLSIIAVKNKRLPYPSFFGDFGLLDFELANGYGSRFSA